MIKSLTIVNHLGEKLKVTLTEADPAHGLLIKDITGLGPADATLNSSDYATNDGSEPNSARLENRSIQIIFLLTNEGGCSIEQARHNTYRMFPTKKDVKLIFETDTRTLYAKGRVQRNTPVVFSDKETVTIDIKCDDPYFYKLNDNGFDDNTAEILTVQPALEFVRDSNGMGELEEPYEVGRYASSAGTIVPIIYEGEVENGFIADIKITGAVLGDITLSRYQTNEYFKIDRSKLISLVGSLTAGDEIIFCTEQKHNYAKIIKDGVETNILNAIDLEHSTWLVLNPGENVFVYAISEGDDHTQVTLTYKAIFQGV